MQEVTQDEFYTAIGQLNVHPQIVGKYPYTSIFKTPHGQERGRCVEMLVDGKYPTVKKYFLP